LAEPTPEQMTPEQLIEQIRQIKVVDMLLSSMSTIAQLGYAKLESSSRDLAEAKLAIEALRALVPVLEGTADETIVRDFRQVVANLQLAFADASSGGEEPVPPDDDG
jgi:hypothetical protein